MMELRATQDEGFSLVEMVLALALFALLSVAVLSLLQVGRSAWAASAAHSEDERDFVVRGLLRRLIAETQPHFVKRAGGGALDFEGMSASLEFLAPGARVAGHEGRVRIKLAVVARGSAHALHLSQTPELYLNVAEGSLDGTGGRRRTTVLIEGLAALAFSYFGRRHGEANANWHAEWSGQLALPQLVRVHVDAGAKGRLRSYDLDIAPRINADVGCVYDALSRRCQGR